MVGAADDSSTWEPTPAALVGRERERGVLRAHLTATLTGHGKLVLVGGEAGVGKTTIVQWLAGAAAEAGALVLWGHCYDLTVTPPYGPWVELARSCQPVDDLPAFPSFLAGGEALFARTWEFFATVASQRPLLLILEDLHWSDAESLALLRVMARQLSRHRVLVVVTYRTDELTRRLPLYQLVPLLVREAEAERLTLLPLDEDAQRALIAKWYPLATEDASRLAAYLSVQAEGNPLYAGELLRMLEEDRVLVRRDNGWVLGDLEHVRVPPMLLQVIEGRLARLDEETSKLLQLAAVIGQEVPLELWQQVSEASDEALAGTIEQGQVAQLLVEVTGGTTYRFRHALIREALYQEVVALRRRLWHQKVGEALAETRNPDPDAVAHHFEEARDGRAARWLLKAGERAQRAYSWVTAAERFDAALANLTGQEASDLDRAVLLFHIAVLIRYVDAKRALAITEGARLLAAAAGEPGVASFCQCIAGLWRCFLGDVRAGLADMEQGYTAFDALERPEQARCRTLLSRHCDGVVGGPLALHLASAGRLEEAISRGRRVLAQTPMPELHPGQAASAYADALFGMATADALLAVRTPRERCLNKPEPVTAPSGISITSPTLVVLN